MRDKLEFTREFTMGVIIEHQQSTIFSVAGLKLRIKLRPRDRADRAIQENKRF